MATKSFLNENEIEEARSKISAPASVPSGDETKIDDLNPRSFSVWLQAQLLSRLEAHPSWEKSGPIALGSWSRGELTPKSDIDLLFVGEEEAVRRLTGDFGRDGMKLRYRIPLNKADWTEGVEPFDVLALISAVPLSKSVAAELEFQKELIFRRWKEVRKTLAKAMSKERKSRAERFDSISNYLEPNLKYGAGGLRDLEQALALKLLYPERFSDEDAHPFKVLEYYKRFFLLVRQRLHLAQGASDLLVAPEQAAIASWLGFSSPKAFMKEIQKGVARVSFYADWTFEQATASRAEILNVSNAKLEKPKDLFEALERDSSVLMQNRVRLRADDVFSSLDGKSLKRMIGSKLTSMLNPAAQEDTMVALFRSRLIDHCVPEFRKVVGHVQHDQYHRFSVDAHILQALRELGRVRKSAGLAGKLAPQVKSLNEKEWEILSFACLYHDIAKGRDGDHAVEGIDIAEQDLSEFGKSDSFIREVTWIVERHLALSAAAFRENPSSPKTWTALSEKGVQGRRIALLAVFTFVDIRATNPDAWTPWKEKLLFEIVSNLEKPEATSAIAFASELQLRGLSPDWVEKVDSFLVSMISPVKLADDLSVYMTAEKDLAPKIVRTRAGQTWIRFHSKEDKPGLFASYAGALSKAGLGIRHASIHTFERSGVYDWFEVKTEKDPKQLEKILTLALAHATNESGQAQALKPKGRATFDRISLVSADKDEWVISFRGKDQSGALLQAAYALFEEGVEIRWARVHTWGRQIDDVFGVKALDETSREQLMGRLSDRFSAEKSST